MTVTPISATRPAATTRADRLTPMRRVESFPTSPTPVLHADDLAHARRIVAGDGEAWKAFVLRYAGLILSMTRRYLRSHDRDEVRTVFANVLESVRRTRLASYSGRASLATWLTLVARSEVMDHLRRQFGRDLKLKALDRLKPHERMLFRLYYVEGLSPKAVLARMPQDAEPWSYERFVATLHHMERKLGQRWLKRLAYDLHAQSVGASSGRLLEYLDHTRAELEQQSVILRPEYQMFERDVRDMVARLRSAIRALAPRDRRLLELRFEHGWKARRIADELGMAGQRGVYSSIERIVAGLRRRLVSAGGASP